MKGTFWVSLMLSNKYSTGEKIGYNFGSFSVVQIICKIIQLHSLVLTLYNLFISHRYKRNLMKKMLLMGAKKVGKTSMHSVIFAQFRPSETQDLGPTMTRKENQYKLMGTLKFRLEDCPGQDDFMKGYFKNSVETIVKDVQVLVYVFDINDNEEEFQKNLQDWNLIMENIEKYNSQAMIFVLLHKIDMIEGGNLESIIAKKSQQVKNALKVKKLKIKQIFGSTIFNQTLYIAWSEIVQFLIPFQQKMKKMLKQLCLASLYDEAALLERESYLVISYYHDNETEQSKKEHYDLLRYQKIANILKQFKIVCKKGGTTNIDQIEINVGKKTGLITQFTNSENIFVVYDEKEANKVLGQINIKNLGKQFNEMKDEIGKII